MGSNSPWLGDHREVNAEKEEICRRDGIEAGCVSWAGRAGKEGGKTFQTWNQETGEQESKRELNRVERESVVCGKCETAGGWGT